VLFRS